MSFLDKAKALLLLRAGLGDLYQAQRSQLLNQVVQSSSDFAETANVLIELNSLGFIESPTELAELTEKLLSGTVVSAAQSSTSTAAATTITTPTPTPTTTTATTTTATTASSDSSAPTPSPAQPQEAGVAESEDDGLWEKLTPDTRLVDDAGQGALAVLSKRLPLIDASIDRTQFISLFGKTLCELLNVQSIRDALSLLSNDEGFGVLEDLLTAEQRAIFRKVMGYVRTELPHLKRLEELEREKQAIHSQYYHLWNDNSGGSNSAQLLIVPGCNTNDGQLHYYLTLESPETQQLQQQSEEGRTERLFFYLDISASMNHDEKRKYLAPGSLDHPSSSILKARNLIAKMSLSAVKKGIPITIVVWNYKVDKVIEFTQDQFMVPTGSASAEPGVGQEKELMEDAAIEKTIRERTGPSVFRAENGTNIEAALKDIVSRVTQLALKTSTAHVWFFTDGEATVWEGAKGPEAIPKNTKASNWGKFNTELEGGLTGYEKELIDSIGKSTVRLADTRCFLDLHVCHFGEAHPIFLQGIRDAADGHFHTLVDVDNLEKEVAAESSTTNTKITLVGTKTGAVIELPASLSDGVLCSRGTIPVRFLLENIAQERRVQLKPGDANCRTILTLANLSIETLAPKLKEGIATILALEPALDRLLNDIRDDISRAKLTEASKQLKELRIKRSEAIAGIARSVKFGTILQAFLEKVLESAEASTDSLCRLLEQFSLEEGKNYDKNVITKQDMLSEREKLAIAAGLESMRVRLGHGFVTQANLDRQIKRLIAEGGARARKMLNRECRLAETVRGDRTLLTLMIIEGDEVKQAHQRIIAELSKDPTAQQWLKEKSTSTDVKETFEHSSEGDGNEVLVNVTLTLTKTGVGSAAPAKLAIKRKLPASTVYPKVVASYTSQPLTTDLDDANKRLMDPLSYSGFTDLIRENNTLPAYLYVISENQSVGLLFNAKELIYVLNGGSDMTSFDYFRFFWRLAAKNATGQKEVQVPGTFSKANTALPLAPEPLTNLVLSNLMPGLISEFVTGTPMAPLTGIGDLYIGFLWMHMRKAKKSGFDFSRIAEILSTIACWVDNPHTYPKLEQVQEIVDDLVREQAVANAVSSGKQMPVKAFAYAMLDEKNPRHRKLSALMSETTSRYLKLFLARKNEVAKLSPQILENQVQLQAFIRKLVEDVAENKELVNDLPVAVIAVSERINSFLRGDASKDDMIAFLLERDNLGVALSALKELLMDRGDKALGKSAKWRVAQRLCFTWFAITGYPISELKKAFAAFRAPTEFENHIAKIYSAGSEKGEFDDVLAGWMKSDGSEYFVIKTDGKSATVKGLISKESVDLRQSKDGLVMVWNVLQTLLEQWPWRGRSSNIYGLHEVDYEVIQALKDTTGNELAKLTEGQVALYHSAKQHKANGYSQYVGPPPERIIITNENNPVVKPSTPVTGDKPRISAIFIGNVDSGKSTTAGHMIVKAGFVDKRLLEKLETASSNAGRATYKYAWIMDKLKSEREKAVTVECSLWPIKTNNYKLDIIDAPGHADFMKNMAIGAGLADLAILIVSATPGEFEVGISRGGQTLEESILAYATGVRQFIVAVNKMDHPDVNYSQSRFQEIKAEVMRALSRIGIREEVTPVVPISGFSGDNLLERSDKLSWFEGWVNPTNPSGPRAFSLLECIDNLPPPVRNDSAPFRLSLTGRPYKISGVGTVVTGRVTSGVVNRGDTLAIAPAIPGCTSKLVAHSLEVWGQPCEAAYPGDVVGINIKGVSVKDLERGYVIGKEASPPKEVVSFIGKITVLRHPGLIHAGYTPYCHNHTNSFPVKLAELLEKSNRSAGTEEHPKSIKSGDQAVVRFVPQQPISLETYAAFPRLGSIILRDARMVVAVGIVISIEYADAKTTKKGPAPVTTTGKFFGRKPAGKR